MRTESRHQRATIAVTCIAMFACAVALPAAAPAAASLTSPADGTIVSSSRPSFSWAAGAGETTESFSVTETSAVDGDGRLAGATKVYKGTAATSFRQDRDLYAGRYFWQVGTYSLDPIGDHVRHVSPVWSFRVPPVVGRPTVDLKTYPSLDSFNMLVKWRGNVRTGTVTVKVKRSGRVVFSGRQAVLFGALDGGINSSYFTFSQKRVRQGTPLTAVMIVKASGLTRTSTKRFRAP